MRERISGENIEPGIMENHCARYVFEPIPGSGQQLGLNDLIRDLEQFQPVTTFATAKRIPADHDTVENIIGDKDGIGLEDL